MKKADVERTTLEVENNLKQEKIEMLSRILQAREKEFEGIQRRQRIHYNINQTYGVVFEPTLAQSGKSIVTRPSRASSALER